MSLMYELISTNNKVKKEFEQRISQLGLTYPKWIILKTIKLNEGIKAKKIQQLIGMDKATMCELLKRLEKDEYVLRTKDEKDKRCFNISLTNKTNDICKKAYKLEQSFNLDLNNALDSYEIEQLSLILKKLNKTL